MGEGAEARRPEADVARDFKALGGPTSPVACEPEAAERITARYRALIEEKGAEHGFARGWMNRVAEELGLHQSVISKIRNGKRQVGHDLAQRTARRLGLDPAYFFVEGGRAMGGDPEAMQTMQLVMSEDAFVQNVEAILQKSSPTMRVYVRDVATGDLLAVLGGPFGEREDGSK